MEFFSSGSTVEDLLSSTISSVGRTAPIQLGFAALSVIITSFGITGPIFNLLQANNFLTKIFRLHCLNRVLKGGGPGTQVPYRIYVNLGYVFACLVALAPVCPLIGIYGMFYFIMFSPMLRWLLVFVYRPRWDGGGDKFPTLHHIIISSLLLGQLIIAFTLILKENIIEGLIMLFCIIPTLLFNNIILEKFLRPYEDAALLQAGRLHYNWSSKSCSCLEREENRRWLVDCHKASYLPTCLSGGMKNLITAEPAVTETTFEEQNEMNADITSVRCLLKRQKFQKGGIFPSSKI